MMKTKSLRRFFACIMFVCLLVIAGPLISNVTAEEEVSKEVIDLNPGALSNVLTTAEKNAITNLTITGSIDARDFKTMRDNMPLLAVVNISEVNVVEYTGTQGTGQDGISSNYAENTIPRNAYFNDFSSSGKTTLVSIIMPSTITSIGERAFSDCTGLTSVTIPYSVIAIGNYSFKGCTGLTSIYVNWETPLTIDDVFAFEGVDQSNVTLNVLSPGVESTYKTANGWKDFKYASVTALILTAGTSDRTSNEIATVKFTSNEEGTYYFEVVDDGATAPDIATSGIGTACTPSETTINVSGLSEGEKDIYIIVKDTTGNEGSALKIDIATYEASPATGISYSYRTHVENNGWQNYVKDGAMSGTEGQSLRLEGIEIKVDNAESGVGIEYQTHVQNIGWQGWKKDGEMSGTSGQSLRLEAIQIRLTGANANQYDVYYQVHAQNYGWLDWAKNGKSAGTEGLSLRLEGIKIMVVPKGSAAPGSTDRPFLTGNIFCTYRTHIQNVGWQSWKEKGAMSGTTGNSLRLEGIELKVENAGYDVGVEYQTHIQNIGWQNWKNNGEMSGTTGQSFRLEAIKIRLTGADAGKYDVYYQVHAQNYGWLDWTKDGESAGTEGLSLRLEGIKIVVVPKGSVPPGSTDRSFLTGNISCTYRTYIQNLGWQSWKEKGEMSGTSGNSLRLEGIEIKVNNGGYDVGVEYQTQVQNIGWQAWKKDGEMSGTLGESLRLEAVRMKLTGIDAKMCDVYYQVYAENFGWLPWSKNGEIAGTEGLSLRLEGIKIVILPKGSPAPSSTEQSIGSITQLVNKNHSIPASYVPSDLVWVNLASTRSTQLRVVAAQGLTQLFNAASAQGITLYCCSGYRSYETQAGLYQWNVDTYGVEGAELVSARPGMSEHQLGLAMDVTSASVGFDLLESFGATPEGRFIKANAHKYGFIVRYPEGKTYITGYAYEPWHLRYVGVDVATVIYNSGKTMEEYYGFD